MTPRLETLSGQVGDRIHVDAGRMAPDCYRRVAIAVPRGADRPHIRTLTAELRDLPGVEMVHVGLGQLLVVGRFDEDEVRALVGGRTSRTPGLDYVSSGRICAPRAVSAS
jgi:hypothetical protein